MDWHGVKCATLEVSMRENLSMPASTVIPVLGYPDVRQAVEWLCKSFGFAERLRIGEHRSQLVYGDGAIVVTGIQGRSVSAGATHSIMVRVADIDEHFAHAKVMSVTILSSPTTYPYGERQYTATDIGGHHWTFSQTVEDVDPATWGGDLIVHAA
jgi:uncharacterized glyoxalase superfamily protein PhnB